MPNGEHNVPGICLRKGNELKCKVRSDNSRYHQCTETGYCDWSRDSLVRVFGEDLAGVVTHKLGLNQ